MVSLFSCWAGRYSRFCIFFFALLPLGYFFVFFTQDTSLEFRFFQRGRSICEPLSFGRVFSFLFFFCRARMFTP
jgi:hypothetical protein